MEILQKEENEITDLVALDLTNQENVKLDQNEKFKHKALCLALFDDRDKIKADDIPFEEFKSSDIVEILLEDVIGKETVEIKKKIREEIRRWHPDKFKQKLGHKIDKLEFVLVMDKVKNVSQAINDYGK